MEAVEQCYHSQMPFSLTNRSNAMQILKTMDSELYSQIESKFTVTGDKINGIKDGIRTEWYSKFDLKSPAEVRSMPYTGVIDRPDLQEIYLSSLPKNTVRNGDGVESYEQLDNGRVRVTLNSGATMEGDVLLGADGIWSAVRATMRNDDRRGGAAYSGYTLFAGEIEYQSPDNGVVGYKVYIGPGQYFVVTDIGKGRYQWYAFLARPPGYAQTIVKPDNSTSLYLQNIFEGWSHEIHDILKATQEHEIEQRDLYDRPPNKQWTDGNVALLGDGIHAMMPNLGQGGCQAIEDALVISEELEKIKSRKEVRAALERYQRRRYIRAAAVQGLSRFASDIIIRGFDTPAKIVWENGQLRFENFNYAGIVTKMLQPILPIFFAVQFNFLYDGWKNQRSIDLGAALAFTVLGGLLVTVLGFELAEAGLGVLGVEALIGTEGAIDADIVTNVVRDFWPL
jgi:zeaxanthin epoxidase